VNGSISGSGTSFSFLADNTTAIASSLFEMYEVTNMQVPNASTEIVFGSGSGGATYAIPVVTPAGGASIVLLRKRFTGVANTVSYVWSGTGVIADADAATTTNEYRVGAAHRVGAGAADFVATTTLAGDQDVSIVITLNGA
jgi:hypothetical protein